MNSSSEKKTGDARLPQPIMDGRPKRTSENMPLSPLTGSPEVRLIKETPVGEIVANWQRLWAIDIGDELRGTDFVSLYECRRSGMRFFMPAHVAGSGRLYEQLDRFDWYYLADKWEHRLAMNDVRHCGRVLEFGCGNGAFVKNVRHKWGGSVEGIELNEHAVAVARAGGLTVHEKNLTELLREGRRYDAICAFQVLEHMSDPRTFLENLIGLLDDGGKLILSVPANDSFTKYAGAHPLDEPPHHMTQWNAKALMFLTKIFPLDSIRIVAEPLAAYHTQWYLAVQMGRFTRENSIAGRILRKAFLPILQFDAARRHIKGHTVYACFQKRSAEEEG
jgi:SAM-dependent methyltransferase